MATATTANKDLVEAVRHYVHFDNLAEALNKQVTNARSMRSEYETKILTNLESTGMKNAVLQINGATLQRATRSQSNPLSWGFLEEKLHAYYTSHPIRSNDETTAILDFLQNRRGSKTTEYLKKTVLTGSGADTGSKKPPT